MPFNIRREVDIIMDAPHTGHRLRMKERFLKMGLESFEPHEVLELLLTYSIPRRNTNLIAHKLIDTFGSISAVFDAPFEALVSIDGITENSATLIKMIPQILRFYTSETDDNKCLNTIERVRKYFSVSFIGLTNEEFKVCCLDNGLNVISCTTVAKGTNKSASISARQIAEAAFKANSTNIIIAHNHPDALCSPSDADKVITRKLRSSLKALDIDILDHIIVGKDGVLSFKEIGLIPFLD